MLEEDMDTMMRNIWFKFLARCFLAMWLCGTLFPDLYRLDLVITS